MKDRIAYCGLDCEKCDAYLATINDDKALREKTAKRWAELNNAPIYLNISTVRDVGLMELKLYSAIVFAEFASAH